MGAMQGNNTNTKRVQLTNLQDTRESYIDRHLVVMAAVAIAILVAITALRLVV